MPVNETTLENLKPILTSTKQIYNYYLEESRRVCGTYESPVVLKLDLYNEAGEKPIKGGIAGNLTNATDVYTVEIDPEIVALAATSLLEFKDKESEVKSPNIIISYGDIRSLPSRWNDTFDLILDLSTIDHVSPESVDSVIGAYYSLMKGGGTLAMVVWCSDVANNPIIWKSTNQYYYKLRVLLDDLRWVGFMIDSVSLLLRRDKERGLYYIIGKKEKHDEKADST